MAGKELGFLKPNVPSLKEQLARKTLRNVRLQGHKYVDLREDGKRYIFFCTLCLAPCYSDAVLYDHLRGNLHKERFLAARATLMGPNPWPFDDGVLFFRNSEGGEKDEVARGNGSIRLLDGHKYVGDLAIVVHSNSSKGNENGNGNGCGKNGCFGVDYCVDDEEMIEGVRSYDLVIPNVIGKEQVSDLGVKLMGYGQISARVYEKDGVCSSVQRIWCEWLAKKDDEEDEVRSELPAVEFGIVTFGYYYDLGKQGLFDEMKTLLLTGVEDSGKLDGLKRRRKKSFSDADDTSETLSHCDSSGEDSQGSSTTTSSALLLHCYDDQYVQSRIISSKTLRRELRRQQRVASEKTCDICQHKMLPGKDVATLLNLKTGRLACSSRNVHGVRRRSKRRVKSKVNQIGKESSGKANGLKRTWSRNEANSATFTDHINSVFCPDCQGTGMKIEGGELEKPTIHLSQMFKYKIKVSDGHRAWMKSPAELGNCSTGFAFPIQTDDAKEKLVPMKLLHFYRADEESMSNMQS